MVRKKRHTEAEIAAKLTEAEGFVAEGQTQDTIAQTLGISVMTYHRWRKARSESQNSNTEGPSGSATLVSIAPPSEPEPRGRYAELQLENIRLRKLVTDLLLEKMKLEDEWQRRSHNIAGKVR
jgi:putative transposase